MYDVKLTERLQIKITYEMLQRITELAKKLCLRRVDVIRQALGVGLARIELELEKDDHLREL